MARKIVEYDNECVSCEHCINCGRNEMRPVYEYICDICGDEDLDLQLYKYNGSEMCKECLLYEWLKNHSLSQIFNKLLEYRFEEYLMDEFEKIEEE